MRAFRQSQRNRDVVRGLGMRRQAGPQLAELRWISTGSEPAADRRRQAMTTWAGGLIVVYGTAHTAGALVVEGAVRYVDVWFSGGMWGEDLSTMSPAMSAYWLSVNSFGPSFVVIGSTVLWLARRGVLPPAFIVWVLTGWVVLDTVIAGPGQGQNLLIAIACGLLMAARPSRHSVSSDRHRVVSTTGR